MTVEEHLENMERELGRVKRRNSWLLGAIVLVAGGLIVPSMFETTAFRAQAQGAGTAKEIRANKFVLEENGKRHAVLSVVENGPGLTLLDENGKPRAGLGVLKDGPYLVLYNENGKRSAGLGVSTDGPGLMLYDENGEVRAMLGILKDGPHLVLYNENGKVIWRAIK